MQESTEPLIVDFSAESRGCAPCLLLSPQLELIAKEYEGRMRVVKIDTDKCLALTSQMKVNHHADFEVSISFYASQLVLHFLALQFLISNYVFSCSSKFLGSQL